MKDDVQCPYCDADQEINHDDGFGYEENELHEMQCGECEKMFTFDTTIMYYYESYQADCLNGGEHKIVYPNRRNNRTHGFLDEETCKDCEYREKGDWYEDGKKLYVNGVAVR